VHRVCLAAPGIANSRCDDTVQGVKQRLQAPEAATRKCRPGEVGTMRHVLYILVGHFPKVCATVCSRLAEGSHHSRERQPTNPLSEWLPSQKGLLVE
jgi:hypothetical protein